MNINRYIWPTRLKRFANRFPGRAFTLLDVGCANGSVGIVKHWLPQCRYFTIDITDAHLSPDDRKQIEAFYQVDLESNDLSALKDQKFDAIVVAHVIEHLSNSLDVLKSLAQRLEPGGCIYVEFPSVRSLNLPNARHTLNFSDDPTHIRVYDVREVANVFLANGLRIVRAGRRREWIRIALSLFTIPIQILTWVKEGRLNGVGLWDLFGFADFVYAVREKRG